MRTAWISFVVATLALASEVNPAVRLWFVNPAAASASPSLRAVLPEVESVRIDGRWLEVASAGLTLQPLGAIDANDREPPSKPRRFVFHLPLEPKAALKPARTPVSVIGVFRNGVPIYNAVSAVSYRDQNLWHVDAVASLAAATKQRGDAPLLASLLNEAERHSPLIGFALDGFPVYGPYGWDEAGKPRAFRSGYRLRKITRRNVLPEGTLLTPAQEGPPVSAEFPLGTFAEDYEYVPGSSDLDEHNGRWTRTPEYPGGTYAYFLATDASRRPAYPYLIGNSYFGEFEFPAANHGLVRPALDPKNRQVELRTWQRIDAGRPAELRFTVRDAASRPIRFLEKVHEQPIHLLIVSANLAEFAHIHPELQPDDSYLVRHTFAHGGSYWLYADCTPPGQPQSITRFRLDVAGATRKAAPLLPDESLTKTQDGLTVKLSLPDHLWAGRDTPLRFDTSASDLEPYLGAWAHILIVSEDRREFIHAHPIEESASSSDPWHHSHAAGPSPASVSTVTGFNRPGVYRLWIQFQRRGSVITIPYTLRVEPAATAGETRAVIPPGAIRVEIHSWGFDPARIQTAANRPVIVAFHREDAQNCASAVIFPDLGLKQELPPGETTMVRLPASAPRELRFTCGMKMYQGSLVIR